MSFARRLRNLAVNLLVLLVMSVLCLLLAELAARLLYPQFNPATQFRLQVMPGPFAVGPPGHTLWHGSPKGDFNVEMKFDQYGFREPRDVKDSTPDDWFSVGDSFTLGFGVKEEERYSNLLEKKIQAAGSRAEAHERAAQESAAAPLSRFVMSTHDRWNVDWHEFHRGL